MPITVGTSGVTTSFGTAEDRARIATAWTGAALYRTSSRFGSPMDEKSLDAFASRLSVFRSAHIHQKKLAQANEPPLIEK